MTLLIFLYTYYTFIWTQIKSPRFVWHFRSNKSKFVKLYIKPASLFTLVLSNLQYFLIHNNLRLGRRRRHTPVCSEETNSLNLHRGDLSCSLSHLRKSPSLRQNRRSETSAAETQRNHLMRRQFPTTTVSPLRPTPVQPSRYKLEE